MTDPTFLSILHALDEGDQDAVPIAADRLEDLGQLREPIVRRLVLDRRELDGRRLLYAEQRQRAGDVERAEFIRVQCDVNRIHACKCAPEFFVRPACQVCLQTLPLHYCSRDLLIHLCDLFRPKTGHSWATLLHMPNGDVPGSHVSRGFVQGVYCSLKLWWEHGPALVALHPVERVTLSDRAPARARDYRPEPEEKWGWTWAPDKAPKSKYFDFYPHCLPESIWRQVILASPFGMSEYNSPEQAMDALSAGCLAWARDEAEKRGLMP